MGRDETKMNAFSSRELELPRLPSANEIDTEARCADEVPAPREQAPARRWWFTFDGWRTADVDAEFVLA